MSISIELNKWLFSIKELHYQKEVNVPHTWNVDKEVMKYRGIAQYETSIDVDDSLRDREAIITFNAVYHSASIFVNDTFIGEHKHSGYTPFSFNITSHLKYGEKNYIKVVIDNTHIEDMFPYLDDFDWADDGGIIRKVKIDFFKQNSIQFAHIFQNIDKIEGNKCSGSFYIRSNYEGRFLVKVVDIKNGQQVINIESHNEERIIFENLRVWDIDNPYLYRVDLISDGEVYSTKIGFRKIEVRGEKIFLNNKETFLKGCEWMPGSLPEYGMAEPLEHSIFRLKQLKDLGCNFTRFHWQQDDSIFEWCDENGLLVQEEIPYWGQPKIATSLQTKIAQQQADEMLHYHFNHPSIIFWGVGNELGGEEKATIEYVKTMVRYFKSFDSERLVNYVSNSFSRVENIDKDDACLYGDITMWNDYLGLWEPTDDIESHFKRTCLKAKGHPIVISEFGLCEPRFDGGDERRCQIIKDRLALYKTVNNLVGYVYFSLNDYRTHCGEAGVDNYRQRVHGSTDLYGNKKLSYDVFKKLNREFKK